MYPGNWVHAWFHIDPEIPNTRHVEIDISESDSQIPITSNYTSTCMCIYIG